jgi:SAM-dependent methyltransferase
VSKNCLLCGSHELYPIKGRTPDYYRCRQCLTVHLASEHHLPPEDEKAIYDTHQNDPADVGYQTFLNRSFEQITQRILPPACGLDFGCGPGPALIQMAEQHGYQMQGYDKFYADTPEVLNRQYDFITCTEVVEHLAEPLAILDQLWAITRPGGLLVIQTKRVLDDTRFLTWHYVNDPTHITFFSETAFRWLADRWQSQVEFPHNDVVVFHK